jgi:hypothetical protein
MTLGGSISGPLNPPIALRRLPRQAIKDLISDLSVSDFAPNGWPVIWQLEPLPFLGLVNDTLGAYIELGVRGYRAVGIDDYRQVTVGSPPVYTSVFYGLRAFTLTLDCRSFAADVPAWDILEGIRLQMGNPRSVRSNQTFLSTGLAFLRTHPTVSLNYAEKGDVDNRMIWRSVMDVDLSWLSAAQVVDDSGTTIGTVGTVPANSPDGTNNVGEVVKNPDGSPWPTP